MDALPETYDEFSALPMSRRRAIYSQLSLRTRRLLWTEQLSRYRATHADLTAEQQRVLDEAEVIFADEESFAPVDEREPEPDRLEDAAIAAFGLDEARRLFATLGPEEAGGSCRIRRAGE